MWTAILRFFGYLAAPLRRWLQSLDENDEDSYDIAAPQPVSEESTQPTDETRFT